MTLSTMIEIATGSALTGHPVTCDISFKLNDDSKFISSVIDSNILCEHTKNNLTIVDDSFISRSILQRFI